jgi:hypothetical protein
MLAIYHLLFLCFKERGWRDSKDDERAVNKTTYNAQRRDEKLQAKQDDSSVWRHDRFLEKDDPLAPSKKDPHFRRRRFQWILKMLRKQKQRW